MTYVQRLAANASDARDVIWRNRLLIVIVGVVLAIVAGVVISRIQRPFVAGANLLVVNGNQRDDPTLSSQDLPSIVGSTAVLTRMTRDLGLKTPILALKRSLRVKAPAYKSAIYRIEYTDSDPVRAVTTVNGVAEELTRYYRETSTARFDDDLRALDAELAKQRERTRRIDLAVQAYGGTAAAVTDSASDAFAGQLRSLEMERALSVATLQGDESRLRALSMDRGTSSKLSRHEILAADETYKALATGASTSALQLANAKAVFTPEYPGLPALESKTAILNAAADAEARRALASHDSFSPSIVAAQAERQKAAAVVEASRAKVAALDGILAKQRLALSAMPSLGLLKLERDAAKADYLSISSRRATALANRADALSLGSVVIVDRAIAADVQTGLSPARMAVIAGVIVLLLSIASAFLVEQMNPRLRRASQIEKLYGSPVIATLGKS